MTVPELISPGCSGAGQTIQKNTITLLCLEVNKTGLVCDISMARTVLFPTLSQAVAYSHVLVEYLDVLKTVLTTNDPNPKGL